jgi:RHS repeat-associated protein
MFYDEASRRILKSYHYSYYGPCGGIEDGLGSGEEDSDTEGGEVLDGDPGDTCVHWQTTAQHYLYDGGILLAIYDKNGTITHSYINGPTGQIGVYLNNSDATVFYFLKDHLGSTRVMVDNIGRVKEYINYDPFGEVLESWASYSEPLTFTGKQRDLHSTFDFYYFGSRYYDYRIGQFASVDKAGQFAGGYLYGGNNPLIGVDPNGNFFLGIFASALWGTLFSSGSAVLTAAVTGEWEYVGKSILAGALTGGIGAGVSGILGPLGNGFAFQALNQVGSSAATSALMGDKINFTGLVASSVGAMATGGIMGNYNAVKGGWLRNVYEETMHMGLSGALSGGISGITYNAMEGRPLVSSFDDFVGRGALGGVTNALTKSAIMGAPRLKTSDPVVSRRLEVGAAVYGSKSEPLYRSGGLWGYFSKHSIPLIGTLPKGFAGFGRDIIINGADDDSYLWTHESAHYWQYSERGFAKGLHVLTGEQLIWGDEAYEMIGRLEWEANYISRQLTKHKF